MKELIYVVDDEDSLREFLSIFLAKEGFVVRSFASGEEALEAIKEKAPSLVVLDLKLPGMDGIEVLEKIKQIDRQIQVIMITAYGTIASAVKAMQKGAFHYVTKPFDLQEFKILIHRALEFRKLERENIQLKREIRKTSEKIIGKSANFLKVLDLVYKVAPTDSTVLILGESGTGKELIAKALHELSPRSGYNFVAINCAALPEELLESELFGYVKGAFTGAISDKDGLFKVAHKGTIFLDEIGDISPKLQVKLLRVLQEKEFTPLGSTKPQKVDVRIIASTNKDIEKLVKDNKFREDLYYRINVITIKLPPLRERKEDIPLLVDYFIRKFSEKNSIPPKKPTKEVMEILINYPWPGNVRELENAVERMLILSEGDEITIDALPPSILGKKDDFSLPPPIYSLEELEKKYILHVLEHTNYDKTMASKILGVNLSTVYRKLKKYGVFFENKLSQNAKEL